MAYMAHAGLAESRCLYGMLGVIAWDHIEDTLNGHG